LLDVGWFTFPRYGYLCVTRLVYVCYRLRLLTVTVVAILRCGYVYTFGLRLVGCYVFAFTLVPRLHGYVALLGWVVYARLRYVWVTFTVVTVTVGCYTRLRLRLVDTCCLRCYVCVVGYVTLRFTFTLVTLFAFWLGWLHTHTVTVVYVTLVTHVDGCLSRLRLVGYRLRLHLRLRLRYVWLVGSLPVWLRYVG